MIVRNKYGEYAVIISEVDDYDLIDLFPARTVVEFWYVDVSGDNEQYNYENYNEIIRQELN